jgi:hypothetical protein
VESGEKPLNAFATLTLAPIDRRLIAPGLLTQEEIRWLDAYHARVADTLAPLIDRDTRAWLTAATRPLGRGGRATRAGAARRSKRRTPTARAARSGRPPRRTRSMRPAK